MKQKIAAIIVVLTTVTMLVGCASQQELTFRSIEGKKHSAITPVRRTGNWWGGRHDAINERLKKGNVGLLFIGDSITHGWENAGKEIWAMYYAPRNAVNMGISGDRTQHVLWRLDHSNFENVSPKLAVILIGVNNSGDNTAEEIADGTIAICQRLRTTLPNTKILLLAIFPTKSESRNQEHATASLLASRIADGRMIHYLDINPNFLTEKQELTREVMPDGVHPNKNGYRIWAEAIESKVTQLIGDAIIYFAASRGDMAKVEALVRRGIDINAADAHGRTALHYAAQEGHKDVVELLLSKGANINAKNKDGKTPLEVALSQRRNDVVKLLLERGADIPTIHLAAFVGSLDKLRSFIKTGTDINAKDERGVTPLLRAVTGRHIDAVGFLIDNGANVNTSDAQDYVPLMYALWTMDSDMVKLLLDKGADVNAKDTPSGYTSLHWAVMMGSKELTELILEAGGDVNAESKTGETPLDLAKQGGPEIVELLRKHGAKEEKSTAPSSSSAGPKIHTVADMIFTGETIGDQFGDYISVGKDVNGDGYNDILVGAPRYEASRGRAYLFYGGPDMDNKPDRIFDGETLGGCFGVGVSLGDINADEYADVIVGAVAINSGRGKVYVFYGGSQIDTNADKVFEGQDPNTWLGRMSCIGDLNGDKCPDLIVEGLRWDNERGRTHLFYGSPDGNMDTVPDKMFDGENRGDRFGRETTLGQDVNGDGYPDLLVGAEHWYMGNQQGRAYLYFGGPKMDTVPDLIFTGEGGRFGNATGLCDIDSDGFADVIVGAPHFNGPRNTAYLYFGGPDMDNVADKIFAFGDAIAYGDVNKDGHKDIALGSGWASEVRVYHGGPGRSIDEIPEKVFKGEMPNYYFGNRVGLSDLNGDGCDDLIVGTWKYNSYQGRVYLYYSRPDK